MTKSLELYNKAEAARETARALRRNQTPAEAVLWEALRNRQLSGLKFLRQHSIHGEFLGRKSFYVCDFYCAALKLVIEVDGGVHKDNTQADGFRTHLLRTKGLNVIRFSNETIMNNLQEVLKTILMQKQ